MERGSRIALQQVLEPAEGPGGSLEQRRGSGLEAVRIFNEGGQPPDLSIGIGVEVLSVPGLHQGQGLPHGIAAGSKDLFPKIGGDPDEILHQLLRMGEGSAAQALQDEADGVALLRLAENAKGVVDVALTVARRAQQGGGEFIGAENLGKDRGVAGNGNL